MKLGLSYSRCVKDIVEGRVNMDQVLIIISGTNFNPRNHRHWRSIWQGYTGHPNSVWWPYRLGHERLFRKITLDLVKQGKLHQPRAFGAAVRSDPRTWIDVEI